LQVLAVRSFETDDDVVLNQYTKYFTDFFEYSRSQGKTKLIIDLSGNAGGTAVLRYVHALRILPLVPMLQLTSYCLTAQHSFRVSSPKYLSGAKLTAEQRNSLTC